MQDMSISHATSMFEIERKQAWEVIRNTTVKLSATCFFSGRQAPRFTLSRGRPLTMKRE